MTHAPVESGPALEQLRAVGGDELVRALVTTFLRYAGEQIVAMEAAATRSEATEIARLAHAIKSSARQFGANALAEACEDAERAGIGGHDVAAAVVAVPAVRAEFDLAAEWMTPLASG